ncbi:sensor domain-containing diguanylate cyclase [Vallitaleaceae bacterium 9-2]
MKLKRIFGIIIILIICQLLLSYYIYEYTMFEHPTGKFFLIFVTNWILIIYAVGYIFRDYTNLFLTLRRFDRNLDTTTILYELLKELAGIENKEEIYDKILEAALKSIPSGKMGSILLKHDEYYVFETSKGFNHEYLELIQLRAEETGLYKLTDGKMDKTVVIKDIHQLNQGYMDSVQIELLKKAGTDKVNSSITAPIKLRQHVIGMISLDSTDHNAFDRSDIEILELFAFEVSKFVQMYETMELNLVMSRYDELTNICNRRYGREQLKRLMKAKTPFVLVSIDLNNLKAVNDMYGHDVGDALIQSFVKNTKIFISKDDIISRYGGDEFIIIFPKHTPLEVRVILDDLKHYLKNQSIMNEGPPISVSFSYGLVEYPSETINYDELLKIADDRMYNNKREKKEYTNLH